MTAEPILLAWSSGKDATLALARLRERDDVRVVGLLTSVTAGYDRVSIHGVRRSLLHAQAESLGLPLHEVVLQPRCSNEDYDAALAATLARVRATSPDVGRIAYGDIHLEDVRRYREERLRALGWSLDFPLWGEAPRALAEEVCARGIAARLVCVDTTQLDASFAGRAYDAALLRELPETVDPCGERGEFHTFVHAAPIFRAPIAIALGEVTLRDERFAYCDLTHSLPSAPRTPATPAPVS